jgi:hypothetical protein
MRCGVTPATRRALFVRGDGGVRRSRGRARLRLTLGQRVHAGSRRDRERLNARNLYNALPDMGKLFTVRGFGRSHVHANMVGDVAQRAEVPYAAASK